MNMRSCRWTTTIFLVVVFCCATNARAQNTGDQVLATWSTSANEYETLYKKDGLLIYESRHGKDAPVWLRETMSLNAVSSISMNVTEHDEDQYMNGAYIKIVTQEGAVLRERHGGTEITRHNSEASWVFPLSEKATAVTVFQKLKSLTGK